MNEEEREQLPDEQRDAGYLGFAPATEEQVAAAEKQLGTSLPAGYRNFLLTSNGWTEIAPFVDEALPVGEIGWARDVDEDLLSAWSDAGLEDVTDIVERSLTVARGENGDVWLLDPTERTAEGEWIAYEWDPGNGGEPESAPGFAALVERNRSLFEQFRGEDGRPVDSTGAEELVELGRGQVFAGDVEAAQGTFKAAERRGSALASYLHALLLAFLEPSGAESYLRNMVLGGRALHVPDEAHLRAELVPLYLRAGADHYQLGYNAHLLGERVPELAIEPDADEEAIHAYREALRIAAHRPPFLPEPPAFQQALAAARRQAAEGDDDGAWATIEAALPAWRTDSPYRLAPVVLLVDPALRSVVTPERFRAALTTPR